MESAEFEWQVGQMKRRIAEIDAMFERAVGWGSWMASASSERHSLVEQLRKLGIKVEHKHVMKADGQR